MFVFTIDVELIRERGADGAGASTTPGEDGRGRHRTHLRTTPREAPALERLDVFATGGLAAGSLCYAAGVRLGGATGGSVAVGLDFPLASLEFAADDAGDSQRIAQLRRRIDWRVGPIAIVWFDFETSGDDCDDCVGEAADLCGVMDGGDCDDASTHHQDQEHQEQGSSSSNARLPAANGSPRILASGVFVPCVPQTGGHRRPEVGVLHLYRDRSEVLDLLALANSSASTDALGGSDVADSVHVTEPQHTQSPQVSHSSPPDEKGDDATTNTSKKLSDQLETAPSALQEQEPLGTIVAVLGVPHHVTPQDFLRLMGAARKSMSHLRIIRDSIPNRVLMLLKFRSPRAAIRFYSDFNGRPFSSFEPEVCHVVFVRAVRFKSSAIPPFAFPLNFGELGSTGGGLDGRHRHGGESRHLSSQQQQQQQHKQQPSAVSTSPSDLQPKQGKESPPNSGMAGQGADVTSLSSESAANTPTQLISRDTRSTTRDPSSEALLELPTCPVCLERMDATVTGLLTIVCHHTFHCHCMMKWGDSTCPVCRYTSARTGSITDVLNGNADEDHGSASTQSNCFECASTSNLWICLICGNIGCGRYFQGHAHKHYQETEHVYALELETQRVWDYVGDGYVHRLIQNKSDGKLVELPAPLTPVAGARFVGDVNGSPAVGAIASTRAAGADATAAASTVASGAMAGSMGRDAASSLTTGLMSTGVGLASPGNVASSSAASRPRRIMGLDVMDPSSGITEQDAAMAEKVDVLGLEYSHILQSQLDSQRRWYERQISKVEIMSAEHISVLDADLALVRAELRDTILDRDRLANMVAQHDRDRRLLEKRLERLTTRLDKMEHTMQEERAMHTGLEENYAKLTRDLNDRDNTLLERDNQIRELQEQTRDLMFFLETQQKAAAETHLGEELRNASVVGVAEAPAAAATTTTPTRRKPRRR